MKSLLVPGLALLGLVLLYRGLQQTPWGFAGVNVEEDRSEEETPTRIDSSDRMGVPDVAEAQTEESTPPNHRAAPRLKIVVEDGPQGHTLAGEYVSIFSAKGYRSCSPTLLVKTNESGIAECEVGPGDWELVAHADPASRRTLTLDIDDVAQEVRITVSGYGEVVGTCVDSAGNSVPAADILVAASWSRHCPLKVGESDSNGNFTVGIAGTHDLRDLFAHTSALGPSTVRSIKPGDAELEHVELVFPLRESAVRGRVVDQNGAALPDCSVSVFQPTGCSGAYGEGAPAPVETSGDGEFYVDGIAGGPTTIVASRVGYQESRVEVDLGESEVTSGIEITLLARLTTRVRVFCGEGGDAVPGALVFLCNVADSSVLAQVRADSSGIAELNSPPRTDLAVLAYHRDCGQSPLNPLGADPHGREFECILAPGTSRWGRVVDESGRPVQVSHGVARFQSESGDVLGVQEFASHADGTFELTHCPDMPVIGFSLYEEGYETYNRLHRDAGELLLELESRVWSGGVRGVVRSEDGSAVVSAFVVVSPSTGVAVPPAITGAGGGFEVSAMPSGSFWLTCLADGFARGRFGPYSVDQGVVDVGVLSMEEGVSLRVSATDSDGGRIEGGFCSLRDPGGRFWGSERIEEGTCTFRELRPGRYVVSGISGGRYAIPTLATVLSSQGNEESLEFIPGESVDLIFVVDDEYRGVLSIEAEQEGASIFRASILRSARGEYRATMGASRGSLRIRSWRDGMEPGDFEHYSLNDALVNEEGRRVLRLHPR